MTSATVPLSLTRAMSTEEGVYGLILVTGLIAAAGSAGSPAWKILVFTGVTVLVFWAAHVYAGTVAAHGSTDGSDGSGRPMGLRTAMRRAVRRSRGLLVSTLLPAAALLLGALGLIPNAAAIWTALWVGVAALGALGLLAYRRKGARWHMQLIGALSTASFGIVIIVAKAVVTH